MLALAQLLQECGLPDGVLNVVTTSHTGDVMEPLIRDPRLRKLTFTGSTEVGRKLVEQSAEQLLRVSMELGGNAPFIVFEDADLDRAVDGAMLAKMRNIGEACTANRFYVHESVSEEFGRRFAERMGALRVGKGTEDGVDVGPLIDAKARDGVAEMVEDARAKGATVVLAVARGGCRLLLRAHRRHRRAEGRPRHEEEIFGPVAPIASFSTEGEVLELANGTEYGLVPRLHEGPLPDDSGQRGAGVRHDWVQPGDRLQPCRTVRRGEGVGLRARRRLRGHRGVPRDQVRRHRPLGRGIAP